MPRKSYFVPTSFCRRATLGFCGVSNNYRAICCKMCVPVWNLVPRGRYRTILVECWPPWGSIERYGYRNDSGYRSNSIAISRDMGPLSESTSRQNRVYTRPGERDREGAGMLPGKSWAYKTNIAKIYPGMRSCDPKRTKKRQKLSKSLIFSFLQSGVAPANQTKERSVHKLFPRGIPEQKFNVNRACFPKANTRIHKNGRSSWTFCFSPFFGLVWQAEKK